MASGGRGRPGSRHAKRLPFVLLALVVVGAIVVTASGLMTHLGLPGLGAGAQHAGGQGGATTPGFTPDPQSIARYNQQMGCATGTPSPLPAAVYSGRNASNPASTTKEVAITFDDGPSPDVTSSLLNVLERSHTPASFFVEGSEARSYPSLIQREWRDGFAIGVHTWDHPQMTQLNRRQRHFQFSATLDELHSILGANTCIWLWRPPYGDYNDQVLQQARTFGLTTIMWDDDPRDWERPGVDTIVSRVLAGVQAGSIILLHDGPAQRQQTVDALPGILAGLKARGLTPVTLPKLLADNNFPGVHM